MDVRQEKKQPGSSSKANTALNKVKQAKILFKVFQVGVGDSNSVWWQGVNFLNELMEQHCWV